MKKVTEILFCSILLVLASCAQKSDSFKGKTEGERLAKFFEWSFNKQIERLPMEMAYVGIKKKQDQLNDLSFEFTQASFELTKEHLSILKEFSRDKLSKEDQLSYDLYKKQAEEQIRSWKWRDYNYIVNQMFGIQAELPSFMINIHQVTNEQDLKNYIARLKQFKNVFGNVTTQIMRSETKGIVPPKFVFVKTIADSQNVITGHPFDSSKKDSVLMGDFRKKLKSLKLGKVKEKDYLKQGEMALKSSVLVAYRDLVSFLKSQEKRATTDDGVWKFPEGDKYYQHQISKMTTTNYTPDQVHEMGLKNVKRIHQEMMGVAKKLKFKGDLQKFFQYTRGTKFFYKNSKRGKQAYLKKAKKYISQMEKQLDRLFIAKPKAGIVVKPVEAYREKSAGMAFYQSPTVDGKRPGTYYVNLSNMKALPTWEAEALAYHEGIPGHHMQLSIAQELSNVPKFRRFLGFTAYVEGWGLYSERLPKEYGFYKDPHSDFGRLSMELVRACRLVVDTGIHHKKWTREQAIAYLDKNLPGDHDDNVRQINRYIVAPGQATAYMIGMLKIVELREKAKKAMGQKFDIRKFHDVILTSGAVPLGTMEALVDDYIATGA